jgi:hypothetical protein
VLGYKFIYIYISINSCSCLGRVVGVAQCLQLNSAPQKVRYAPKIVRIYQQKYGMGNIYIRRIPNVEDMQVVVFPPVSQQRVSFV